MPFSNWLQLKINNKSNKRLVLACCFTWKWMHRMVKPGNPQQSLGCESKNNCLPEIKLLSKWESDCISMECAKSALGMISWFKMALISIESLLEAGYFQWLLICFEIFNWFLIAFSNDRFRMLRSKDRKILCISKEEPDPPFFLHRAFTCQWQVAIDRWFQQKSKKN